MTCIGCERKGELGVATWTATVLISSTPTVLYMCNQHAYEASLKGVTIIPLPVRGAK